MSRKNRQSKAGNTPQDNHQEVTETQESALIFLEEQGHNEQENREEDTETIMTSPSEQTLEIDAAAEITSASEENKDLIDESASLGVDDIDQSAVQETPTSPEPVSSAPVDELTLSSQIGDTFQNQSAFVDHISDNEASEPSVTPPPPSSGGAAKGAFAGLITGALAAVGVTYYLPPPANFSPLVVQSSQSQEATTQEANEKIASLTTRLDQLEQGAVTPLTGRIEKLEATAPPDMAALAPQIARLEELSAKLGTFEETINKLGDETTSVTDLNRRIEEFDARVKTLEEKLSGIEGTLAQIASKKPDDSVYQNALTVVLSDRVERRVLSHLPFEDLLGMISQSGIPEPDLNTLRIFANSGIPSGIQMEEELLNILKSVDDANRQKPLGDDASFGDKIKNISGRFITSYPKNTVSDGDKNPVALVRNALRKGSLHEALNHWQNLPDDYKIASTPWRERLEQVIQAQALATRIVQDATQKIRMISPENQ